MSALRRRIVRVPASSANLGPGFDVLAAALSLYLTVEVVETGSFGVVTDLDVRRDRDNLVVRAFELLHPADEFEFHLHSTIPLSGGLGSSAAAIVGGLLAADDIFSLDADLLELAMGLEKHPDNVAAALRGGIVICDGPQVTRLQPPAGLEAVLVVPRRAVATSEARRVLSVRVPRVDAVANLAAIAQLTLGLARSDWGLIAAGLRDRLHQPQRAALYPRSAALLERAHALGALGATISGAGPTVLFWSRAESAGSLVEALQAETDEWAQVVRAQFEPRGATVTSRSSARADADAVR